MWHRDTIARFHAQRLLATDRRVGTFTARIEAPGYQLWQRSGLHAEEAACGVIAAVTTAELVRD